MPYQMELGIVTLVKGEEGQYVWSEGQSVVECIIIQAYLLSLPRGRVYFLAR